MTQRKLQYIFIISLLFNAGCSNNKPISLVDITSEKELSEFENLNQTSIVTIADENEAGERLYLCLTFRTKENKELLKDQKVLFYQANVNGEYKQTDPNDESTARLNGTAITDSKGRIFVKTVLPGDYGSTANNRHIHTTVFGAKPEAYDIHFLQYVNGGLKRFIKGSDQHFLANLKYTSDSSLVAFLTIEPKGVSTMSNN